MALKRSHRRITFATTGRLAMVEPVVLFSVMGPIQLLVGDAINLVRPRTGARLC